MRILQKRKSQFEKCLLAVLLVGILSIFPSFIPIEAAVDLSSKQKALDMIGDFADRLCNDISINGDEVINSIELSGEAKAELRGLIKELANLGFAGTGKYKEEGSSYHGVPRIDVKEALGGEDECKLKVFMELKSELFETGKSLYGTHNMEVSLPGGGEIRFIDVTLWTIDATGVCRDDDGKYPRWSDYNWSLIQCEANCKHNPNCQGFAMSKTKNYCQLMGIDGLKTASRPGTRITRGDASQPQYTCYLKR